MATELWDQLPHETHIEYTRFLVFRNCGVRRSLRKAFARWIKDQRGADAKIPALPRTWRMESTEFRWHARAAAWDIRNLAMHGARIAAIHVNTLVLIAQRNLEAVRKSKPGDDAWVDILHTTKVVAEFLSPEIVREIEESQRAAITEQSRAPLPPEQPQLGIGEPADESASQPVDGPTADPDE